jgi:ParB family chromosome partitioning protein
VRLGIDRSTIANIVRLLDLPEEVQTLVRQGMVTMGHARAILSIESAKKQVEVAARVAREDLSVRQVERIAKATGPAKQRAKAGGKAAHVRDLESRFREALGTKVTLEEGSKPGSGRIVIEFYNHDDLDRILAKLS